MSLHYYPMQQRDRILANSKASAIVRMGKAFPEPAVAYVMAQPHGSDLLDLLCPTRYQTEGTDR